jgi:hypothetical protein
VREFAGENRKLTLDYFMADLDEIVRYQNSEEFELSGNENGVKEIRFDLPKDSFGEFVFKIRLSDGESEVISSKDIFLPSQTGLTGLAISDDNKRALSYVGVAVVILLFLIVGVSLFRRFKKKTRKIGRKHKKGKHMMWEVEL